MAYTERIKNFKRIREYMRDFYVYGFKTRDEYDRKSARSYDNERRRIENYLGDYMSFHQTKTGKRMFLSVDTRTTEGNPFYKAFRAKSFTDGDISLHFALFDVLDSPEISMTLSELVEELDEYFVGFTTPLLVDESTLRKKLNEYHKMGLISKEKQGKQMYYRRGNDMELEPYRDALHFFSEIGLCGVVGSYLLDRLEHREKVLAYKHHYITQALDSEVLYALLQAMQKKCNVEIKKYSPRMEKETVRNITPLRIFVSAENGRRHLIAFDARQKDFCSIRLDYIQEVKAREEEVSFDSLRQELSRLQKHMWGVVCHRHEKLEHVEFTVYIGPGEEHIWMRLEREKRCGNVERLDECTARFSADVYETSEMIPWIRSYICRIMSMDFSNKTMENMFRVDLKRMYRMYGIGGEDHDIS